MSEDNLLSAEQINLLLSQKSISAECPWCTNDDSSVEGYYKAICAELTRKTGTSAKIEWNHYGSGYASFIDAWFYKPTSDFSVPRQHNYGEAYTGLVVLLARLGPYYVLMEGEKTWHPTGGSSYLPNFDSVDSFDSPAIAELATQIGPILKTRGMKRLYKDELVPLLPEGTHVPTILADPPFRFFDALFYWED